jgi:hypothetical protein
MVTPICLLRLSLAEPLPEYLDQAGSPDAFAEDQHGEDSDGGRVGEPADGFSRANLGPGLERRQRDQHGQSRDVDR